MKIELGKQYKTRDGRKARIYAVDCGGSQPVHGAMVREVGLFGLEGRWHSCSWTADGHYLSGGKEWDDDLVPIPEHFDHGIRYLNVYSNRDVSGLHLSREGADRYGALNRIACIEIAIKGNVGEGL